MIANTTSGKRLGPLASYLVSGRSGTETDRVAWTAGRNIGTDDPSIAALVMQATARQSVLVQAPVYHLTISFDPKDRVTPDQMQNVADRVLGDLGLSQHQSLMVAHKDREHAHLHVMVNRVHPDTGVSWERWQDRPKIERALREIEQTLGLRRVAGRLHEVSEPTTPERSGLITDGRREIERTSDPAFAEHVRSLLPELRAAKSWEELSARLAEHGLRVEGKGQGLVFTDGEHEVKASRVGRDLSLRRLEERYGAPYPSREELHGRPVRAEAELSPIAAELAGNARDHERVRALHRHDYGLERERASVEARRQRFADVVHSVNRAAESFDRSLSLVYRDPASAREQIRSAAVTIETAELVTSLRREPERFGVLRTEEQSRAFGLLSVADESKARRGAHIVAGEWTTLLGAERQASAIAVEYVRGVEQHYEILLAQVYRDPTSARNAIEAAQAKDGVAEIVRALAQSPDRFGTLRAPGTPAAVARLDWAALAGSARNAFDARLITSSDLAKAHTDRVIEAISVRKREVRHSIENSPSVDLLERVIGRAVNRLEPHELTQLRRVLTSPQAAIVFKAQKVVRDVALGRDEIER